jgi:ferric-dicitrate binding protein FerR (iron transport regulator)
MPYKDPERKRQWEREHHAQRNARRRMNRSVTQVARPCPKKQVHEPPPSVKKTEDSWKVILGLAVGFGVVLLAAMVGAGAPTFNPPVPPQGLSH